MPDYLNVGYGIESWLLTTDHKRIALLYLICITVMFFLGGFFAVLIRLELPTPEGRPGRQADTYNKLFTMHGVMMVFFFLIPSIPAVLGNFLVPLMIGAKDLAFPRLNLPSWYIYIDRRPSSPSGRWSPAASTPAGPSTRPQHDATTTPTSSRPPSASSSPASRRS